MPCQFDSLKPFLQISYTGEGSQIARDFYIPVLKKSTRYYRLSGYFSIDSLAITAAGLAGFINNNGHMQLVVGAHDVKSDLILAQTLSKENAQNLLDEISSRITEGLDTITDIIEKERLKALAWMIARGSLEVKVAIPKKTFYRRGNGIFHEKLLIMDDGDGCSIEAKGSANETRQAYDLNGESLDVHMSWRPGAQEYIDKAKKDFNSIWQNQHPDYFVFSLPDAIKEKLRERFYPDKPPLADPVEIILPINEIQKLLPLARCMNELGSIQDCVHLGLGPVRLYPHQTFTADFVLSRFPYRCLLADEVGLGKTLEAGAIIKRLVQERQVDRILILAPKNVARQWMEEMDYHFDLHFRLYESSPRRAFIDADGNDIPISSQDSLFDYPGVDYLIVSWHYARRDEIKRKLLESTRGFDLIVVDESHAARNKRSPKGITPTKLNDLCMELSISTPHILLLSATPVQLRSVEALDLLRILGLGGRWVHEKNFEKFYSVLQKENSEITEDEWVFSLQMIQNFASGALTPDDIKRVISTHIPAKYRDLAERMMKEGTQYGSLASALGQSNGTALKKFIMSFSPLQWYMIRNTRKKLEEQGFSFPERIIREEIVHLNTEQASLLEQLDDYLNKEYAAYERLISSENRGTIGFVRTIYHQRFVSSFSAAHATVKSRLEFLDALLNHDEEAVRRVAEKFFDEEEADVDEEEFIETVLDLLDRHEISSIITRERDVLANLEHRLSPFAIETLTLNDPKLQKIYEVFSDLYQSQGRKVLIFSKYVDTINALHSYFKRRGFPQEEMALYSGSGGLVFDPVKDAYSLVGKEEVRKALEGPHVGVVLCTDAASEGLNLQAASAIINVDMPWNPAKVEQRIGRVDRLGQLARDVQVVNVWYPNTIEANMYKALFERKEIYHFVVGPAQEIFSERLRQALDENARGEELKRFADETIRKIDEMKADIVRNEGVLSGTQWGGTASLDEEIIKRIRSFIELAAERLGYTHEIKDDRLYLSNEQKPVPQEIERWNGASLVPGKGNALTPAHPLVKWLIAEIERFGQLPIEQQAYNGPSYYIVKDYRNVGTMIEIDADGLSYDQTGNNMIELLDNLLFYARGESA